MFKMVMYLCYNLIIKLKGGIKVKKIINNICNKLCVYLMISLVIFSSFFSYVPFILADGVTGVTTSDLNIRSGPGTNNSIIGYIPNSGIAISLLSTSTYAGDGCLSGWLNISYNGTNGYVCSKYVTVNGQASNGRPWTSPRKAIYGGAAFNSSGYISKGQNTMYLQKYNVSPCSSYKIYNHQYMANLAAPMNQASTEYKIYNSNGLLSLPLHFIIPVYQNMPAYTSHPVAGVETGGQSEVTDQSFEDALNAQGFDETYKRWLRSIHNSYPNWTFEALYTGLDFETAVVNEQASSSISSVCTKCRDSSNTVTESGWYVANTQTVEYFLDPRNFMEVDSILMYEDLGFSDYYTQDMVQSALNGTFMAGNDALENISYASIFYNAGKTYNISPIYLVALSRQEVNSSISSATNGAEFEYKGITYSGFYNFFNIGAYSSEENPSKAGLVYASEGTTPNSSGVYTGNIGGDPNISSASSGSSTCKTNKDGNSGSNSGGGDSGNNSGNNSDTSSLSSQLSSLGLNQKSGYVTNFTIGQTVGSLSNVSVSGKSSGDVIATGDSITFASGTTLTAVIYGDLTGDGAVNSADLLAMRLHLLGTSTLSGALFEASHVKTSSGTINSADLLQLRQQLLGTSTINQS
jgi:beta-N-acetylglucosaminidase